jgi:hypothetical protein
LSKYETKATQREIYILREILLKIKCTKIEDLKFLFEKKYRRRHFVVDTIVRISAEGGYDCLDGVDTKHVENFGVETSRKATNWRIREMKIYNIRISDPMD